MDNGRFETREFPLSEWVSEWRGAACRVRQAMRSRLIVSDVVIRDIRNVLTFAIPNPMRLLLWRLRFFLLDRKLPLYAFESNLNPLSHRVVLGRKCNFLGSWFFDIRGSAKNDTCFATIHLRALKNSLRNSSIEPVSRKQIYHEIRGDKKNFFLLWKEIRNLMI